MTEQGGWLCDSTSFTLSSAAWARLAHPSLELEEWAPPVSQAQNPSSCCLPEIQIFSSL